MLLQPDTTIVKTWLAQALATGSERGLTRAGLAAHCRVSRQAVNGWCNTGRIAKGHLTAAVHYFGSAPDFKAAGAAPVEPLRAEQPRARYAAPVWPFELLDVQRVQQLDRTSLLRLETIVLTVASQLGMVLNKKAAA